MKSDREELHKKFNRRSNEYIEGHFTDEDAILTELDTLQTDIRELSKEIGEMDGKKPDSKMLGEARAKHEDSMGAVKQYSLRIERHIENGTKGSDEYNEDAKQAKKYTIDAMRAYIDLYLNL